MRDEIKRAIQSYNEVYFEIGAIYERLAKMHGLKASSLFVLQMIYEYHGQCTQRFICERLLYPKQTVNTILDSFEKKGYIFKEVVHSDKRNKFIFLTQAGQRYADQVLSDMFYMEEASFENMGETQRKAMMESEHVFLEQLTKMLHTLEKAHSISNTKPMKNQ